MDEAPSDISYIEKDCVLHLYFTFMLCSMMSDRTCDLLVAGGEALSADARAELGAEEARSYSLSCRSRYWIFSSLSRCNRACWTRREGEGGGGGNEHVDAHEEAR